MEKVNWKWDNGVYAPFCPHCNEPAYEQDSCVFCGKAYAWVENPLKPKKISVGDYEVIQATNHHVHLYKNGKMVMHIPCSREMTEEELKEQIKFYETIKGELRT